MKELSLPKRIVLASSSLLFAVWLLVSYSSLTSTQNGFIRFSLGLFFFFLILTRKKKAPESPRTDTNTHAIASVIAGTIVTVASIIFDVHQLEWLGLLLLLFSCLRWALPAHHSKDLLLSFLLLYWAHPLPSALFASTQLTMQNISVRGSEWILHLMNVRVWADHLVLRTGYNIFEIPAWCSGMRTATTVFLLALGLGIMRKMKWYECAVLIIVAIIQAIILNIIRISLMVILTPVTGGGVVTDYLHNSLWFVLIAGVLLIYVEINLWYNYKRRKLLDQDGIPTSKIKVYSEHPPFWRFFIVHSKTLFLSTASIALIAFCVYKSRPIHRANMIIDVAEMMRDNGKNDDAYRAARKAEAIVPDNQTLKMMILRLLVIRGKFDELLVDIDNINLDSQDSLELDILRAYSLMGKGEMGKATAIINSMSDRVPKTDPRAAMIMAEMSHRANDPDKTARHIITASIWRPNIARIRRLYPYLYAHHKWEAIVKSDINIPYTDPIQLFSAVEAYMNMERISNVSELSVYAMETWPRDPRVLIPLFYVATRRNEVEWEERFASHLTSSIESSNNIDLLYEIIEKCFQLGRPDLAWSVMERIRQLDSEHPALIMSAVNYGNIWFVFRKHMLQLPAGTTSDMIDLKPFYNMTHSFMNITTLPDVVEVAKHNFLSKSLKSQDLNPKEIDIIAQSRDINDLKKRLNSVAIRENKKSNYADKLISKTSKAINLACFYEAGSSIKTWQICTGEIPFAEALSSPGTTSAKKHHLKKALAEFKKRDIDNNLSVAMQNEYVRAMEMSGDIKRAKEQLEKMVQSNQISSRNRQASMSKLYEQKGEWHNVYEMLYNYHLPEINTDILSRPPKLSALLRLCRAQLNLRLGLGALFTARQAVALYPQSPKAAELLARALTVHDTSESAFNSLKKSRSRHHRDLDKLKAICLFRTERYIQMQEFCRTVRLTPIPVPLDAPQTLTLPPAEFATQWHLISVPSDEETEKAADLIKKNLKKAKSPFLESLMTLWLKSHKAVSKKKNMDELFDLQQWQDIGRNRVEKATALNNLTLLQCSQKQFTDARNTAGVAVKFMPESAILWRILISLSESNPDVISTARKYCPMDSEIWLAELVSNADQLSSMVIRPDMPYSTDALTRAGDYILRKGNLEQAAVMARTVLNREDAHLPAYILGLRCAIALKDNEWTLTCANKAIEQSLRARPFLYQTIVELKTADGTITSDNELLYALNNLRDKDPTNALWAQMLGYIRFNRGGSDIMDAKDQMNIAIDSGATNVTPFVISAESARLLNNHEQAIVTLRKAIKLHPDNIDILNNYIYTLAQTAEGIEEAVDLLPSLIRQKNDNLSILDTISVVYLNAGELDKAETATSAILDRAKKGESYWFMASMHKAQIILKRAENARGPLEKAEAAGQAEVILKDILRGSKGISDENIIQANQLLRQCTANSMK